MDEGIDLTLEGLKEQLISIRQNISRLRKKGADTKIAELKIMAIPSKIKIAEATREYKDVEKINILLNQAVTEIKSIESEALKSDEKGVHNEIKSLVENAYALLKDNKFNEAKERYLACIVIYKTMPDASKKEIFNMLNELRVTIGKS